MADHKSKLRPFDERGVGRYHDADLMARTALMARERGNLDAARTAILLPGVLDRVAQLERGGKVDQADDRPHMIDGRPASTEEIAPIIAQHAVHAGIAFFPDCPACQAEESKS